MLTLAKEVDAIADKNGFAGVVSVDRGGQIEFVKAYGLTDRANEVPNAVDTRFGIASGTKGLTAYWMDTPPSSRPASGSPTATAGTSFSR